MNIYEKLQAIRCELQGQTLKKSGKNEFVKYAYFELSDFIPAVNLLMKTHKITSTIQYDKDIAKLTLINCEKPEETLIFTSPMADGGLKACSPVQNLGASITYLRRYLWINALEIIEADSLDASTKKEEGEHFIPDDRTNLDIGKIVCSDCSQPILTKEGAEDTKVINFSKSKYGKPICWNCQQKKK
uniref:Putative Erf family protein n=1 Tax=viral metagenome TaxID=1070528 RepID=A0A6M3LFN0_9ZZZZ